MEIEKPEAPWWQRYILAITILLLSFVGILILAIYAIKDDGSNALTILNMSLPVFASWVGTILAFYFGKENFESANTQIREMFKKLTPEEKVKQPAVDIMRKFSDTTNFKIPDGKSENDIVLSDIRALYTPTISRLPIVSKDDSPLYMIHASSTDKYLLEAEGSSDKDSLAKFIKNRKDAGIEFGFNKGFVVVSEKSTIADAKSRMEQITLCQDIFITKEGTDKEALQGWVSNIRLTKYLQG